jgi:4-amino-4-deoxy-L-arabinose transferase-like glycosyltransferase
MKAILNSMRKRKNIFLIAIVLFAAFLRFYNLGTNPPSLTWDEAALGYNAYTLGIDGRDEFGRFLPLDYLESFGDFKPPLYSYLSIVPVWIFGLTEFATRFASAFFGTLTVLLTYFLVYEIFRKWDVGGGKLSHIALLTSFILAISPWHILLSRAAFEANVASFFLVLGVYFFLSAVNRRPWLLVLSSLSFVFSIYTFNTARVVAPLLVLGMTVGFYKKLWNAKRQTLAAGLVGFLMILPIIPFLFSEQAALRFKEVNIFSDVRIVERSNQEIANDNGSILSRALHNRRFYYGLEVVRHYFDNLSFNFLFIEGDQNPKFSSENTGQMYLVELPFFIAGIFFLIRKRMSHWWIIPLWLLVGLFPASLARETPHALRTEAALPTFQILTAFGALMFLEWMDMHRRSNKKLVKGVLAVVAGGLFINVLYFLHGYFVHYPRETSREWQYGYKESIAYVDSVSDSYDEVWVSRQFGRPYIYYLFYMKVAPEHFRQTAVIDRDVFGFVKIKRFGKYYFGDGEINVKPKDDRKVLVIETPERVPANSAKVLREFKLRNGEGAFQAYTFN